MDMDRFIDLSRTIGCRQTAFLILSFVLVFDAIQTRHVKGFLYQHRLEKRKAKALSLST